MNEPLLNEKWRKFLKLRSIFSFIPFLDFVLVAGSMALGNVREDSDFDVIIGARKGRIFTVRGFCIASFAPFGLFQRRQDIKKSGRDKVCFNHFVTPRAYRFSPPYNDYWRALYHSIVPVYGKEGTVREFFRANNDWAPRGGEIFDEKYWKSQGGLIHWTTWILEWLLGGWLGDLVEKVAKKLQMSRIGLERSLARGEKVYKPRVRYDDEELEFHPDTRRIEEMLKKDLRFK